MQFISYSDSRTSKCGVSRGNWAEHPSAGAVQPEVMIVDEGNNDVAGGIDHTIFAFAAEGVDTIAFEESTDVAGAFAGRIEFQGENEITITIHESYQAVGPDHEQVGVALRHDTVVAFEENMSFEVEQCDLILIVTDKDTIGIAGSNVLLRKLLELGNIVPTRLLTVLNRLATGCDC